MQKIVLFDIDGVILSSCNYEKFLKSIKSQCSLEDFRKIYSSGPVFEQCEKGRISIDEFWMNVKTRLGADMGTDEFIKLHASCRGQVFEETIEVMKDLKKKGYKIGILSNLKSIDVDNIRKIVDIKMLDYEFYSCYVHALKPNREIFEHVARVVEPLVNEVYFFDNVMENCCEAEKWGIKAICATGFDILEKSQSL